MRATRLFALVSVVVAAAVLAGCSGEKVAPTPEESAPAVDVCGLAAPAGPASQAIRVDGAVGSPSTATFPLPLAVSGMERSVIVEGDGPAVGDGMLVQYAMSVFDAATGAPIRSEGYGAPTLPVPASTVGQVIGCAPVGSRLALAVPASDEGGPTVWVVDVTNSIVARATGAEQEPAEGMPKVALADNGAPTITVPAGDPPAETRVAVLKKGDGASVAPGDTVIVHYSGVRWSDGTFFDSSWNKGAPTALVTSEVIPGYREALEGQTVGSQVLVVIPPSSAYGEGQINESDLTGETLVFVVDILATSPTA